jgi:hypothetical protein
VESLERLHVLLAGAAEAENSAADEFERLPSGGRILTNFLLELGLLGFLALSLAVAARLISRPGSSTDKTTHEPNALALARSGSGYRRRYAARVPSPLPRRTSSLKPGHSLPMFHSSGGSESPRVPSALPQTRGDQDSPLAPDISLRRPDARQSLLRTTG